MKDARINPADQCSSPEASCSSESGSVGASDNGPFAWFGKMIQNCYEYASARHAEGRPIVGIMCEYAPRELIMATGAVPVCLCGGAAEKRI